VLRALSKGADDFNAALIDKTTSEAEMEEMVKLIHKYVNTDQPYDKARGSIVNGAMRLNAGAALNTTSVKDQLD
jgi:NitT/TauT family transport system substrate-binding protein